MKRILVIINPILLVSLLCACNLPQGTVVTPNADSIASQVAATLTQAAQQTPLVSPTTHPPTLTSSPLYTPTITITPIPLPGSLEGIISGYPYGSVPRLIIVAYEQEPPYNYAYVITEAGSTYYFNSTDYLVPGPWLVVAYDASGNSGGCTTIVTIISNQSTNCNINDWASAYPLKKSGIPNP